MRIALFNDTGRYAHIGCRGVSSGHDYMLDRLGMVVEYRSFHGEWRELASTDAAASARAFHDLALRAEIEGVDAVVVNGEGTIHHGAGRHLLAILRGPQSMGRRTALVNAVFQESEHDLDVLMRLDDVLSSRSVLTQPPARAIGRGRADGRTSEADPFL